MPLFKRSTFAINNTSSNLPDSWLLQIQDGLRLSLRFPPPLPLKVSLFASYFCKNKQKAIPHLADSLGDVWIRPRQQPWIKFIRKMGLVAECKTISLFYKRTLRSAEDQWEKAFWSKVTRQSLYSLSLTNPPSCRDMTSFINTASNIFTNDPKAGGFKDNSTVAWFTGNTMGILPS